MTKKTFEFDAVIGIDPGSNGGIATWRPEHPVLTSKMPKDYEQNAERP